MSDGTHAAVVEAAQDYVAAPDLWIVTSYFNPGGFQSKRRNYERFRAVMQRSGLQLWTIESSFGTRPFELSPAPDVWQLRAPAVMWQKERLLNVAIRRLPERCRKVAWVDCDVLFANADWAVTTAELLERYWLVQPYATCVRLARGATRFTGDAEVARSAGAVYAEAPRAMHDNGYEQHGETGFAWAARREVLEEHGLYDTCIIGGGDHVMAHAMAGDTRSICLDRLLGRETAQRAHFTRWASAVHQTVQGSIGHVDGMLLHLWHGERVHRRYTARHRELEEFGFDPARDLRISASGCWDWASAKPAMHAWAAAYFSDRHEDGAPGNETRPSGGESISTRGHAS